MSLRRGLVVEVPLAVIGLMAGWLTSTSISVALDRSRSGAVTVDASERDPWVSRPGGWRLASRGHRIQEGHALSLLAGRVLEVDAAGRVLRVLNTDAPTAGGTPGAYPSSQSSNWISWAYWTRPAGHPITADTASWVVPPPPATYRGQTIYLFNGIEDTATFILQAVLQYGPVPGYGGGQYWQAACYLVGGLVWAFSGAIRVNPGDVITGIVDSSGHAPESAYSCTMHVNGQPRIHMDLVNNDHYKWPEFYVAVETLEASGVGSCTDYPDVDSTAMTSISIGTHGGNPHLVDWFPVAQRTDCHQHPDVVSSANPGGDVDLFYRKPQRNRLPSIP